MTTPTDNSSAATEPTVPKGPCRDDFAAPVGPRFAVALSIVTLAVLIAVAGVLHVSGLRARWKPADPARVVAVSDAREALDVWRDAGVENAVLVSASGRFGFQTVPFGVEVTVTPAYPVELFDVRSAFASRSSRDNYLWVASQVGLFRTIHYVLTPAMLEQRVMQGRAIGAVGIAPDGTRITPNNNGYLRSITAAMPELNEPAVLNVDASYFEDGDPARLASQVRSSGTDFRIITLDRSLDDTATTAVARARLEEFGRLMGAPR